MGCGSKVHHGHDAEHGHGHDGHSKRSYKYGRRANVNDLIAEKEAEKSKKRLIAKDDNRTLWERIDIRTNPEGPMRR